MRYNHKYGLLIATGILFTLPAASQDTPESLLPPGFDDPPAPEPSPVDNQPSVEPISPSTPAQPISSQNNQRQDSQSTSSGNASTSTPIAVPDDVIDTAEEASTVRYIVPRAKRRSLGVVGVINQSQGGFPVSTFANSDGEYMMRLTKSLEAPFLSRWVSILTRRLLLSKTAAPQNVDGADWVAERAWLLLRMGESVNARHLIQQVDANQYSSRLYNVSMPVFLANGDLAGFCPLADAAARTTDAPSWKMSRAICLSLSGEQSRATSMLNRARRGQWASGVDYLLAEKAIGAGTNGRRAVKIEWDDVRGFNAWRHGLSIATGVKPPERFYNVSGRHVRSWLVLAPMISINDRILSSYAAAANGTLSNKAMVDLFASAEEDKDASVNSIEKVNWLNQAYTANVEGRIEAMRSLWNSRESKVAQYSMKILTARAAARIMPTDLSSDDVNIIVSSMMTAGLDTQSLKWLEYAETGSLAWAQIMVGSDSDIVLTESTIDSFTIQDDNGNLKKTKLFLAALDGLGRIEEGVYQEAAAQYNSDSRKDNRWSRSLSKAVDRDDKAAVVLLVAAGLQGNDWSKVPAFHLYHLTKALKNIGLEAEARMIAAEAIDRA